MDDEDKQELFDGLLDEVAEEFGSSKDGSDKKVFVGEVVLKDTQGEDDGKRTKNSTQSEEVRPVEVSRRNKDRGTLQVKTETAGSVGENRQVLERSSTGIEHDIRGGNDVHVEGGQGKTSNESEVRPSGRRVSEYSETGNSGNETNQMAGPKNDGVTDDQEGITWYDVGEMPTKKTKRRVNVTTERKNDEKSQDLSAVFGFGLDKYAVHREVARKMFNEKTADKPRWAVRGCVLLRDQGVCQICGEKIGDSFDIVQIIPNKLGGSFNEGNCLTVCGECKTCWRSSYTPKYMKHGMNTLGLIKQKLAVLRRRVENFHGCRSLKAEGLLIRRVLMDQKANVESALVVEGQGLVKRIKYELARD